MKFFFVKEKDVGSNSDVSDVIDEPVAPREKAAGARRAAAAAAVSLTLRFAFLRSYHNPLRKLQNDF